MSVPLWITPEEVGAYSNTEFAYEACKTASYLLWGMSGRKYTGLTTTTERYVCSKRAYRLGASSQNYGAVLIGGDVFNVPINDFDNYAELVADGLSPESRIRLRGRNVQKIHAVRNRAGQILSPSTYYLVDHSVLQATAGVPWTPCNVEVTYTYGDPVPMAGRMAARTLAMEFAKLWSGDDDVNLPARVTTVARQGVTFTLLDSQDFIDEVRTGVYSIDLFLKTVNPDGARRRSRIFTPDVPRARTQNSKTLPLPVSVNDLVIHKSTAAHWDSVATSTDVTLFWDQPGWTPTVVLGSYDKKRTFGLPANEVYLNNTLHKISFDVDYSSAYQALGMVDPGQWTLFATKNDPVTGLPMVSEIVTGNLSINLVD